METPRDHNQRRFELPAILETLASELPPARLPLSWDHFTLADDCFLGAQDPAAIVALLRSRFPDQSLIDSRVVIRKESGNLALTGDLADRNHTAVLLRKANGDAFDMLTDSGCLSGRIPMFNLWHDRMFQDQLTSSTQKNVFGVLSISDFLILRSLGIAAATVSSLGRLSTNGLRRLLHLVGASLICSQEWLRKSSRTGRLLRPKSRCRLLLVAASIANMNRDLPSGLTSVVHHLSYAQRELDMVFEDAYVWRPGDEFLASLEHGRQLGDPSLLRRTFQRPHRVSLLSEFVESPPRDERLSDVERYLASRAQVESLSCKTPRDNVGRRKWKEAIESFQKVGFDTLIAPLLNESYKSSDPVVRILGVNLAETTQRVNMLTQLADADLQRQIEYGDLASNPNNARSDSLMELPRHINGMLKLVREYRNRDSWRGWSA